MNCRICGGIDLTKFLDLGHHPPSDAFLTEEDLNLAEVTYPLTVWMCNDCSLAQLGYTVSKNTLFNENYPYTTGSNKDGIRHFRQMAKDLVERHGKGFVVDIGGNDGTLLRGFRGLGCTVLNIEPCANIAAESPVPTINHFWDSGIAKAVKEDFGKAHIITATNVLAHVDDLHGFMRAVNVLLDDDGVFVVECPDFVSLLATSTYDTIYHEHLSYFDVFSMTELIKMHHMEIVKLTKVDIHGGSNRYEIQRVQ